MAIVNVGSRIVVVAPWHSRRHEHGIVVQTSPHLRVLFAGERLPERVEAHAVVTLDESATHLAGAE